MNSSASARLLTLAEAIEPPSPGISLDVVGKIKMDERVRADILTCLYDVNPLEVSWGLWFCEGLIMADKLDGAIAQALLQQIPFLLKSGNSKVRSDVVSVLIKLRSRLPKYRDWMLQCLRDSYPTVRMAALLNSQTFLKAKEIDPLLTFKEDDYLTETSMGSPLVYLLRNEALDRIEQSIGRTFERKQLSAVVVVQN
jgi:hypothetical protein